MMWLYYLFFATTLSSADLAQKILDVSRQNYDFEIAHVIAKINKEKGFRAAAPFSYDLLSLKDKAWVRSTITARQRFKSDPSRKVTYLKNLDQMLQQITLVEKRLGDLSQNDCCLRRELSLERVAQYKKEFVLKEELTKLKDWLIIIKQSLVEK